VLFQLSAHRIHVINDDGELPDTPLRQTEYFARWGVLVSRIVPQRDVRVLQPEDCQVLLLVQRSQAEDLPVERLRALKVPDDQVEGKDLLLPFSHFAPPSTCIAR